MGVEKRSAALACLLVLVATGAEAALPPSAYEQMRRRAPIVALLQIVRVTADPISGDPQVARSAGVFVRARVLAGVRGGLGAGQLVTIRYTHYRMPPGWSGPAPVPILKAGQRVRAWLRPARGGLEPAAGAASFEDVR